MAAKYHLDPAHTDDLTKITLDEMDGLGRHGVEADGDLHGVAMAAGAEQVGGDIAASKGDKDAGKKTRLGIGEQVEGDGTEHGTGFRWKEQWRMRTGDRPRHSAAL